MSQNKASSLYKTPKGTLNARLHDKYKSRLLSFYKHLDFSVRKDSFRLQINLNLNENLKIFLDKFPKFDIKYTAFYRKKKKKMEKSNGKKIK